MSPNSYIEPPFCHLAIASARHRPSSNHSEVEFDNGPVLCNFHHLGRHSSSSPPKSIAGVAIMLSTLTLRPRDPSDSTLLRSNVGLMRGSIIAGNSRDIHILYTIVSSFAVAETATNRLRWGRVGSIRLNAGLWHPDALPGRLHSSSVSIYSQHDVHSPF